jgi:hypothetical protein
MTQGTPWGFEAALGLDYWACSTFFGQFGITVSTLSGLVRDGKDGPFKLYGWQRTVLRWIEPRLGRAHVTLALQHDVARLKQSLSLLGASP